MTFVHPSWLIGLTLGLVPIVIYYLIRFRSLRVEWGASYVLERAIARLKKKVYLEQLFLLALRVLAILAIVIAFARPVSSHRTRAVAGTGTHRVIVLDASYSMLAGEAQATSWDKCRAALRDLTASWGRGDRWSLYLMDRHPRWVVDDQPVETPERTRAILDALEPTESTAALAPALELVLRKTAGRDTEIYIAADDQATTWKGVDEVRHAAGNVRLFWIHPPPVSRENLAVTRVTLSHDRALVRHPCRVQVGVRNFGLQPAGAVEIEILADGAFAAREQISLLPDQEAQVPVEVTFDEAGSHSVTARLRKDALEFDNAASAGIDVVPQIVVAVIREAGQSEKFASSWGFLDLAAKVLNRKSDDGAPLFAGGVLNARLLEGVPAAGALAGTDVVVVDGGSALTAELATALGEYVRRGGGLVLAADDAVDLKQWNDRLGEAGLLPARLLAARREALGGERFMSLARAGFEVPALKALEAPEDGDIAVSRLYSWTDLGDPVEGGVVLARFPDGRPFAVEKRFGPGSVILLAAGLNSRNNNLMVREFMYPLIFNLFCEAASGSLHPRTLSAGAPLHLPLRGEDPPVAAQFALPGRPPVTLVPQESGGARFVALPEGSDRSGLGSILLTWKDRSERVWFGIQGDRADSDLRPMDPEIRAKIAERWKLEEVPDWEGLKALLEAGYRGEEWHHWALLAALLVLLGEMAMQRRFA